MPDFKASVYLLSEKSYQGVNFLTIYFAEISYDAFTLRRVVLVEALNKSPCLKEGQLIHLSYINCFSTKNSNPLLKNSGLLCDSVKTDNNMLFFMFFGLK